MFRLDDLLIGISCKSVVHITGALKSLNDLTWSEDGAKNFHDAYRKEFWSQFGEEQSPVHIRHIRSVGDMNNKMGRQNGEVRDREKVMRGLKTEDTPILKGYQIYHSYIRPHSALKGLTPTMLAKSMWNAKISG